MRAEFVYFMMKSDKISTTVPDSFSRDRRGFEFRNGPFMEPRAMLARSFRRLPANAGIAISTGRWPCRRLNIVGVPFLNGWTEPALSRIYIVSDEMRISHRSMSTLRVVFLPFFSNALKMRIKFESARLQ